MKITLIESSIDGKLKLSEGTPGNLILGGKFSVEFSVEFADPVSETLRVGVCSSVGAYFQAHFKRECTNALVGTLGLGTVKATTEMWAEVCCLLQGPLTVGIYFEGIQLNPELLNLVNPEKVLTEGLKTKIKSLAEEAITFAEASWREGLPLAFTGKPSLDAVNMILGAIGNK